MHITYPVIHPHRELHLYSVTANKVAFIALQTVMYFQKLIMDIVKEPNLRHYTFSHRNGTTIRYRQLLKERRCGSIKHQVMVIYMKHSFHTCIHIQFYIFPSSLGTGAVLVEMFILFRDGADIKMYH